MKVLQTCCQAQIIGNNRYRQSQDLLQFSKNKIKDQNAKKYTQTPLKLRFLDSIGLKQSLINNFVFANKISKYQLQTKNLVQSFKFQKIKFEEILGYEQTCDIIDLENNFIPVIHFKKISNKRHFYMKDNQENNMLQNSSLTVIYSHGNSSSLQQCYQLVSMMVDIYKINFIIYDYTGYGNEAGVKRRFNQKNHKLNQNSIHSDLKKVIQWSKLSHNQIVLWGFSLGCSPTISFASSCRVNAVILQSPFASIYTFFKIPQSHDQLFQNDMFNNIQKIGNIKCSILLFHSSGDEMIPIEHSRLLMDKFQSKKKINVMRFIEVAELGHNQMHQYFCSRKQNQLQKYFKKYIIECIENNSNKKNEIDVRSNQQGVSFQNIKQKFQLKRSKQHQIKKQEKPRSVDPKSYLIYAKSAKQQLFETNSRGQTQQTEYEQQPIRQQQKCHFMHEIKIQTEQNSFQLKKNKYFSITQS